jgi:hypothetical protein
MIPPSLSVQLQAQKRQSEIQASQRNQQVPVALAPVPVRIDVNSNLRWCSAPCVAHRQVLTVLSCRPSEQSVQRRCDSEKHAHRGVLVVCSILYVSLGTLPQTIS